jgi:hypothetical protein
MPLGFVPGHDIATRHIAAYVLSTAASRLMVGEDPNPDTTGH